MVANTKYFVYVGTYTHGQSEGIYIFTFDALTGVLEPIGVSSKLENPSYLALSKNNKYLYTTAEVNELDGKKGGAVAAFSINNVTGNLEFLNYEYTKGKAPCHISVDKENKYLFAANYGDGTCSFFPLDPDGAILPIQNIIHHKGSGPNKERQEKPHVHYVTLTPEEKYLCAVDLGIDKVVVYEFDRKKVALTPLEHFSPKIKPGSGPRHMVFHLNGRFAYVINELSSDIVAFKYDNTCLFEEIQYIKTLPDDFKCVNYCSAIHVDNEGKYLYASNRGHNSIAVFKIDKLSGKLQAIGYTSTKGKYPRDFAIDPMGNYLIVANQNSDSIIVFRISPETGELEETNKILNIPSPVCIKFLKRPIFE
jgi:6-phosphogluconolactonase